MKSNDLRLGNKIKVFGRVATVDGINHDSVFVSYEPLRGMAEVDTVSIKHCEPIELTREVMEGIGFEWYNGTIKNYEHEIRFFDGDFNICKRWYEIKHLHHLQNMVYFIKGVEL
jgi:hypothetical protein